MCEKWKYITGTNNKYMISSNGRVKSFCRKEEKILKQGATKKDGYPIVGLRYPDKVKLRTVHRIVAEEFINRPDGKNQVNHINGIKSDNRAVNLEWSTPLENITHMHKNNMRNTKGSANGCSKLDEMKVLTIRTLKNKYSGYSLSRHYNVSQSALWNAANGRTWKHVKDGLIIT